MKIPIKYHEAVKHHDAARAGIQRTIGVSVDTLACYYDGKQQSYYLVRWL